MTDELVELRLTSSRSPSGSAGELATKLGAETGEKNGEGREV
jgi:hypothetical protein